MESHVESCWYCHCHDDLCAPCTDFEKMLELGGGLVIYRHKPPSDTCKADNKEELLIIYNTKNVAIISADVIPEIDKSRISCPRCRRLIEHAQTFLQDMPSIDKNKVVSVCEHCRKQAQYRYPCHKCEDFLKKFVAMVKQSEKKLVKIGIKQQKILTDDELDTLKRKTIPLPGAELQGSRYKTEHELDRFYKRDSDLMSEKPRKEQFTNRVMKAPVTIKSDISVKKSLSEDSLLRSVSKWPIDTHSVHDIDDDHKKSILVKHLSDDKIVSKTKREVQQKELDESFLNVVTAPSKDVVNKEFRYLFPRDKSKKVKSSDIHVTSTQLITETQDRLRTKVEEEKKKQEELLQKIFEQKEKKRIAHEEKIKLAEEEKERLVKEKNKRLEEKDFLKHQEHVGSKHERSRKIERNLSGVHRDESGKFVKEKGEKQIDGTKPHREKIEKGVETEERYAKGEKEKQHKIYGEKDENQKKIEGMIKKDEKPRGSDGESVKDQHERRGEKGGKLSQTEDKSIKDKDSRYLKKGEKSIKETDSKHKEDEGKIGKEKDDKLKAKGASVPREKDEQKEREGKISSEKDDKSKEKEGKITKESDQKSKGKDATVSKETDEQHKKLDTAKEASDKQKEKDGKMSKETIDKLKESKSEKSKEIDNQTKGKDGKVTKDTYDNTREKKETMSKDTSDKTREKESKRTTEKDEKSKKKEEPGASAKKKGTNEVEENVQDNQKGDKNTDEKKQDTKHEVLLATNYIANQAKAKQTEEKLKTEREAVTKKAKESAEKAAKLNFTAPAAGSKRPLPDAKALKSEEDKVQQTQTKVSEKTPKESELNAKEIKLKKSELNAKEIKLKKSELNAKEIKLKKPSHDDLLLNLIRLKQREPKPAKPVVDLSLLPEEKIRKKRCRRRSKKSIDNIIVSSDSELEVGNLDRKGHIIGENDSIIIGPKIYKNKNKILEKQKDKEKVKGEQLPILFKSAFIAEPLYNLHEEIETAEPLSSASKHPPAEPIDAKGIIRYALSDRTFIEKGWTLLPTEKVVRKMNVYRMRPAHPEFDWFEHNKNKRLMCYDSGEKLAEFDDNGRGRWFYRNGRVALDYYDAEETNAQQRFVIYSNGELDQRGRSHPITVLATFDYLGNGVVFDHAGKIRIKYNQTEGVVLDRALGPVSHWKWHSLNDPPVLQQVMIDTHMSHKDPEILKLPDEQMERIDNEEMLAIEFDNFIKEKSKKLTQKFKPFQIKMKALKINEQFSLRILDQATIYLIFRDGTTCLKMNLGMILDHREIIDTDTADMGDVSNTLERLPARTDSIGALQHSIAHAQRVERSRTERERRLRPPEPCESADQLTAALSKPLRQAIIGASSGQRTATTNSSCRYRKPSTTNIYYNTRLI